MQPTGVSSSPLTVGGVVPALRYNDVRAAAQWLCNAFGFEEHRIISDEDGAVRYAQLACGSGMIMLCPVGGSAFDAYMAQPTDAGDRETQVCYVHVPDALAHKARALEAGAELVLDIDAGEGRGQGYSCRDPEGHVWSFGTYDPWRNAMPAAPSVAEVPRGRLAALFAATVIVSVLGSAGFFSWLQGSDRSYSAALASIDTVLEKPVDLESAEKLLKQTRAELARERALRMQSERGSRETQEAREKPGDVAQRSLREDLQRERDGRVAAEKLLREARAAIPSATATDARPDVVMFPSAKPAAPEACAPTASAPARTASAAGNGSEEMKALRRAMEEAQAQLKQERARHRSDDTADSNTREALGRERAAREAAERAARDANARVARIEAARRAEYEKRNGSLVFKDLTKEVFKDRGL